MSRFILLLVLSQVIGATDWSQWRGPNRDGSVTTALKPPATWPAKLSLKWKTAVGEGDSSPVVSGDSVFVLTRTADNEMVSRIDLSSGRILWSKSYAASFQKNPYALSRVKGPFSTPLVHEGRLYTLGVSAILSCWDASTGELRWRKDYSKEIDTSKMFTGTAMSPLLERGKLIVHVGDDRGGRLIAFDAVSGVERWVWRGDGPGYASPIVVEIEGVRQVVTQTDRSVVGVDAASGKLLWTLPWKDEWNENIVTPVAYGKSLILSGVRKPTQAIAISRQGEQWAVKQIWQNGNVSMYMSSPVLDGDLLCGIGTKRKGQFFCLDAKSGATRWITDGREGESASVVSAGPFLLFLKADGNLVVARKSGKAFEPVARYTVAESATWSHPVLLDRRILVKDTTALALWSME